MSFEAFTNEDVQKIVNHTLESMSKEHIDEQVKNWGSIEKYKEHLSSGFTNEQAVADLLKWYGSKEKAIEAIMQSTGNIEEIKQEQEENAKIYKQFMAAKESNDMDMAHSAVDLQKQLIASLVQAVLHMLLMPFSIITGHNKLAITGGEIRRFFLPPVLFGE